MGTIEVLMHILPASHYKKLFCDAVEFNCWLIWKNESIEQYYCPLARGVMCWAEMLPYCLHRVCLYGSVAYMSLV